jgi:cbb3-type cytochrome oxidase subunit 3
LAIFLKNCTYKLNSGYLAGVVLAGVSIVAMLGFGFAPGITLFALLPLALGIHIYFGVKKAEFNKEKMIPYMGKNVVLTLLTSFLLGGLILVSIKF